MLGLPPETVPEDLHCAEYFSLAKWYKEHEWLDQARLSLNKCIELAGDEPVGEQARIFLGSKIPRHPVPKEAVSRLHEVSRLLNGAELAPVCEKLIADYPDFEWPYNVLAGKKLTEGNVDEAIRLLKQALSINPDYDRAIVQFSLALAIDMNYELATVYIRRALSILPEDEELAALSRTVESVMAWDTIPPSEEVADVL
jgi:tetratricopeptide (TPR) repeat protein